MAHSLPLSGSPLRELFAVADLVAIGTGQVPAVTIEQARRNARVTFENRAVHSVVSIAWDCTRDQLQLVQIGRRGGVRRLWTFGGATSAMVLA